MTKPKMAEGSRFLGDALVEDKRFRSISCDKDGDICIETDDSLEYVSALDVIRVAVAGGPLRPLWDAAVRLREHARDESFPGPYEWKEAQERLLAELFAVIDDMKEPKP